MRQPLLVLPVILAVAASACGPNNDTGYYASGSVRVTSTDSASSTPTETGFTFTQQTRVDPTLPGSATMGFTGTCQVGPNGRTVHIARVPAPTMDLSEVSVTMPDWSQDSCTDCNHGTIIATIGNVAFTGTESRGSANNACTFNAVRNGSFGMQLTISCTGLTSPGDARTVGIDSNLTLEGCDGQDTTTH